MFAASKSGISTGGGGGGGVTTDPQFKYVAALLNGDGTNGAQNSTFIDSSTNNATITRFGNATQGTAAPYGDSWSTYFPSSANFISAALAANQLTGSYTIEFWFNATVLAKQGLVTVTATATSGGAGMSVYIDTTNALTFFISGNATVATTATNIFSLNTWNHIAVVYVSSPTPTGTLYLNGTSVATLVRTATFSATPSIGIGRIFNDSVGTTFGGYISNLRILKGTALYTANFTPPTTPLTAITNTYFLTSQANNFLDNGPNALALTMTGAPTIQRFSPFGSYSVTPTSYSTKFNGSTDYLTVPYSATQNLAANSFTIEAWIFPTATPADRFGVINNWQGGGQWQVEMLSTRLLRFTWTNAASGVSTVNLTGTTALVTLNIWNHIAIVRDGTTLKLYVNGIADTTTYNIGSGTLYYYNGTTKDIRIGVAGDVAAATYFTGNISNLRLVNGTAVYTANFTPPTAPLTAITNTSLLTCQNTTIIDNSTNAFTLTATGSPTPKPLNPFGYSTSAIQSYSPAIYGGSGYYDGTGDYLTIPYNAAYNFALNSQICFEAWVYTTSTSVFVLAGRNWSFGGGGPTWSFYLNGGITPVWGIAGTGSAATVMAASAISGVLGQWNHYAFTRDSSNVVRIFVNGVLGVSRTDGQAMTSASGSVFVGVSTNLASPYANGYMSNVRLVVGSPIYISNFVPPAAPLTAVTNTQLLLSATNAGIYDSAMISDYETSGTAQVSTSIKKYGTGSIYFATKTDYLAVKPIPPLITFPGNFTFECWVYPTNAAITFWGVWDSRNGGASSAAMVFYLVPLATPVSGSYRMAYFNGTSYYGTGTVLVNQWTHLAWVRSGTTLTYYVNGVAGGTSTVSGTQTGAATTTPIYVGNKDGNLANYGTIGYIDDLRVTNGVARYVANFTPPTAALPTS